jgi:putative FmdB family regulatory protein
MPMYDYECSSCDYRIDDVQLSIDDRLFPTTQPCPSCNAHGTLELCAAAPQIGDAYRLGRRQLPSTWTDTLKRIKQGHHRSTINDYGSKREI